MYTIKKSFSEVTGDTKHFSLTITKKSLFEDLQLQENAVLKVICVALIDVPTISNRGAVV